MDGDKPVRKTTEACEISAVDRGGMRDQERAAFSPCVFLKIESVDRPAFQPEAADT